MSIRKRSPEGRLVTEQLKQVSDLGGDVRQIGISYLHQCAEAEYLGPCALDADLYNKYIDDVMNPASDQPHLASVVNRAHQQITVV